jgi:hypothetical protein
VVLTSFGATSAAAAPADDKVKIFKANDLKIKKGDAKDKTKKEDEKVQKYIKEQSKGGRGLDLADVFVASADYDGGTVGIVFEVGDSLDSLIVRGTEDTAIGLGAMMLSDSGDAAVDGKAGADAGTGNSAALRGRGCRSLFYDAAATYTAEDHYIYDCWEKFQSTYPGRGYDWFYNRYTLFNPADPTSIAPLNLVDATIRFRPWAGRGSTVADGPFDYAPKPSSSSEGEGTLSVTAGPASITLPAFRTGSSIEPLPRSDTRAMGTDWDGSRRTNTSLYLDSAATFTSGSDPIFADYVWQTVAYRTGGNCCNANDNDSWNDTGW